jgi:hypothetical protein
MAAGDNLIAKLDPEVRKVGFSDVETYLRHLYLEEGLSVLKITIKLFSTFKIETNETAVTHLLKRFAIPKRSTHNGKAAWSRSMKKHFI